METRARHDQKCERVARQMRELAATGRPVRLAKSTSNLFRHRTPNHGPALQVGALDGVLSVDTSSLTAEVEGMAPYDAVVRETLRHGLLPAVTPQLKSITVGGAVSGVGIESSSFRYGLVHHTLQEMEVLLASGRRVLCSPAENADLFYGFPNSYGTLGYALRLSIRLIPSKRYVHLFHRRFDEPSGFFAAVDAAARDPETSFLDGTVFGPRELYLTEARFTESAPGAGNYRWMNVYYRSIRDRAEDWLTASDYIWRWDTDWFWCSKNLYAQHWPVRLAATPLLLNSRTYQWLMRWAHRHVPDHGGTESVIQDVDIPLHRAPEFLEFLLTEIRITPVWICPFRAGRAPTPFDLYPLDPTALYINFGFWDVIPSTHEAGHYNRLVEQKLMELGGTKGLYSAVYFDEPAFWKLYNGPAYSRLKARYDPGRVLPGLYEKCAGGQASTRR